MMEGWMQERITGWMFMSLNRWMDEQVNGWTNGCSGKKKNIKCSCLVMPELEGWLSDEKFLDFFLFRFNRSTLRKLRAEDMFETWVRIIPIF